MSHPTDSTNLTPAAPNTFRELAAVVEGYGPTPTLPTAKKGHLTVEAAQASIAGRWKEPNDLHLYQDAHGNPVAAAVRSSAPGSRKLAMIYLDASTWHSGSVSCPRPLFRLPDLIATPASQPIFLMPSERSVEQVIALGRTATTFLGGYKDWARADLSPFAGRSILITPNEDVKPSASRRMIEALYRAGATKVAIVTSFGAVTDLAGLTAESLVTAESTPKVCPAPTGGTPGLICLADVEPLEIDWLWPGKIARGRITVLAGDPGLGKSFVTLDLAARISTGDTWPDGCPCTIGPASTVLLNAEDDLEDTVRPRLDAARADVSKVRAVRLKDIASDAERPVQLPADIDLLRDLIETVPDAVLLIIDPITAFVTVDWNSDVEVRSVYSRLAAMAEELNIAILIVAHLNKNQEASGTYRVSGSVAVIGAARAAFCVAKDKDDPDRRVMLPVKNNLGPDREGLAFRLFEAPDNPAMRIVQWEGMVTESLDDHLRPSGPTASKKLTEAKEWLEAELAGGPRPPSELRARASEAGIAPRTLDRAKSELGVVSEGHKAKTVWRLPNVRTASVAAELIGTVEPETPSEQVEGDSAPALERQQRQERQLRQSHEAGEASPGGVS